MKSSARSSGPVARVLAWLVLALMLASALYAAGIGIVNYSRIQV